MQKNLQLFAGIGLIAGLVWGLTDGQDLYRQYRHRERLVKSLAEPYRELELEYKKLVQLEPRYTNLLEILLREAKGADRKGGGAATKHPSLSLDDFRNMPPSFKDALSRFALKFYSSGASGADLEYLAKKIDERSR